MDKVVEVEVRTETEKLTETGEGTKMYTEASVKEHNFKNRYNSEIHPAILDLQVRGTTAFT
ncbi:hypothetical protein [Paenibacillus bovis]|uniref:Uncharacterized protein n=1 Tax=Paenibacillus bovis TaxID=1616788 RepID=A0A172ZDH6_9BACL|nr:hypothetical protein [Paenibacillus bovis]ANF95706.1 hypothetical protein AR543_06630 [Paenibacillus bovis]